MQIAWGVGMVLVLITILLLQQWNRKLYELPKEVWTHWDSDTPPTHVQTTVNRMNQMLPDWNVNFVTTRQFLQSIPSKEIPANFDTLSVAHQADWIRLKLLQQYGGCWMDSGIVLNQSINPLYTECVRAKADLLVFKILGTQTNPAFPVAENWFIMAPKHSPIITLWLQEFEQAIAIGFHSYKRQLKEEGVDLQNLMMTQTDVYLTQHGCFQKVIQHRMPPNSKILYHPAEETMFKLQATCKWEEKCIAKALKDKAYCQTIPYIKLRGADRKLLDTSQE